MGIIARIYDFVAGTKIRSADIDAELNQLVTAHNDHDSKIGTLTSPAQTQLDAKIPLTQKAAALGVATLDSGIKVPVAQIPSAIPASSIGGGVVDNAHYAYLASLTSDPQTQLDAKTPLSHVGTGGTAHAIVVAGGASGFMTGSDKTKLDGIAAGAEVNQSTFSTIAVAGQSDVVADQKTDTLTLVGGIGITITTNPTTDEVTLTATGEATPGAHASSHVTGGTDVIANAVAGGNAGLMSGADKTQVNLIAPHLADYTEHVPFGGTTTGSANTYVLSAPTIAALTLGMAVSVKFNVDSTGASTLNWDGKGAKGIKKPNGTDATNLKATGIYTLRYDGTNFILQGEGGGGNAIAAHLLAGETATVDSGDIVGTMVDHSGVYTENNLVDGTFTANRLYLRPPIGFYDGVYSVYADDPDFIAENWPNGVSVFGLVGTGGNVKRWATGPITSVASTPITVNGLAFTPSKVMLYQTAIGADGNKAGGYILAGVSSVYFNGGMRNGYGFNMSAGGINTVIPIDAGAITVNGFTIPWSEQFAAGIPYRWYAFE